MQDFRKLEVWRKSHALALNVQRLSLTIPKADNSGLISQLRRAALSIPANIVEGTTRSTQRDFAKFLQIAIASGAELEYHLQFAVDSNQIPQREFDLRLADLIQIRKMLYALHKRVAAPDPSPGS